MKVLFTGSSYIYKGNTSDNKYSPHQTFLRLAEMGGHEVESHGTFIGGSQLSRHWNDNDQNNPRDELATGEYDLMVFNGGGGGGFGDYAKRFSDLANANGTDIVIYGIWAPDNYIDADTDRAGPRFHNQYSNVADNIGAAYSPNGMAYNRAHEVLTERFGDNGQRAESMLTYDNIHASPMAALLVASTLYATIFGTKAPAWTPPGVSAADARLMQDIAWETARDLGIGYKGSLGGNSNSNGGGGSNTNPKPPANNSNQTNDEGRVEGKLFIDANDNNRDDGEAGLGGVQVSLFDVARGRVVDRVDTNSRGEYSFDDVDPGRYTVRVEDVSGASWARANVGSDASDSDIESFWKNGGGETGEFRVNANQTVRNVDAGIDQNGNQSNNTPAPSGNSGGNGGNGGNSGNGGSVNGTSGNDTVRGTERADVMNGRGGRDDMSGRGGNDYIDGGGGADRVFAGGGNDKIVFDFADTHVYGGGGTDTFLFSGGTHNFNGLRLESVEVFDLENNRADRLTIEAKHAQQSQSTLRVDGDGNDELRIDTNGSSRDLGSKRIDGETYDHYRLSNGAEIYVDDDIDLSFI